MSQGEEKGRKDLFACFITHVEIEWVIMYVLNMNIIQKIISEVFHIVILMLQAPFPFLKFFKRIF